MSRRWGPLIAAVGLLGGLVLVSTANAVSVSSDQDPQVTINESELVHAAAATKKWMVPRVRSAKVTSAPISVFVEVKVRVSKKLRKKEYAHVQVRGGGEECLIIDLTGSPSCTMMFEKGTTRVSLKVRSRVDWEWRAWSKARTFNLVLPGSEPDPTPAPAPTGFMSLQVIGPPLDCERNPGPSGLSVPISSSGPDALPATLTQLSTRLEVTAGDYTIRSQSFTCQGIRYTPTESVVTVTVPRSITGYAFLYYKEASGPAPPTGGSDALSVLNSLTVQSESRAGYDRSLFRHWIDADGDGCDTREEVLLAEATAPAATLTGCRITGGAWVSMYDGVTTRDPSAFDVDHLVPLAEAWDSGASAWDASTRQNFANDLGYAGSLIAVSASSNRSKSDRDPAEWLPASVTYRCTYVTTWIAVKYRWSLTIDTTEKTTLRTMVDTCGNPQIQLPPKASITSGGGNSSGGNVDPRFPTCTAAKAAGYGPYYRGIDPEYYWYRDADSDGIVCE